MLRTEEIGRWFDRGVEEGYRYMFVRCDTFDYECFPSYHRTAEEAQELLASSRPMERVMECYDLEGDRERQLTANRAWALPEVRT